MNIAKNILGNDSYVYFGGSKDDTAPKNITRAVIASQATTIHADAFKRCSWLTTIGIPNTVNEIGEKAFKGCTGLKTIQFQADSSLRELGPKVFKDCTSLTSIAIPYGIRVIPDEAFHECSSLTSVYIPETVVEIGNLAFKGCKSLTRLQIPKSVTKIGYEAFVGCDSLRNMTKLPLGVQNFPDCLFSGLPQNIYIQSGPGPRYGFKGKTQYGYGPEMCGITLQQLEDLKNHPSITENMTMREVAEKVIKPATKDCGMGYSLLINQKKPLHAQVMVSHAWDETFYAFLTCLRRSGHKGPFWICTFAIYQNQGDHDHPTVGEQLGSDPEYGPFATVLKAAKLMMAVITDTCDIYTRLW